MITSERQYQMAKEKLGMLKKALKQGVKSNIPLLLAKAAKGQTQELMDEMRTEIQEYETLKKSDSLTLTIHSIEDLMKAPIRYRIAKHMTIEEFARKVNVHSRQISRYEKEQYKNANSATLLKILNQLEINIEGELQLQ